MATRAIGYIALVRKTAEHGPIMPQNMCNGIYLRINLNVSIVFE